LIESWSPRRPQLHFIALLPTSENSEDEGLRGRLSSLAVMVPMKSLKQFLFAL
jgi:hypothetical protein